jgi:hypothetical protein
MPNTKILKDKGQEFYPITHVSCVVGMENNGRMNATYAWDGTDTPDVSKIPSGVVVTYNGTTYTGTLAASASTTGMFYLVPSTTVTGEWDRYITEVSGSSFAWKAAGNTAIPSPTIADNLTTDDATQALSAKQGKVLDGKVSQLRQEVTADVSQLEAKVTDLELPSGSYTQAQARVYNQPGLWSWLLIQPGTTIKKPIWHIGSGVFIDAVGAVVEFPVVTPATPTFSPDGGSVPEGTVVTLACATPDADIYVSTDDGETYTKTSTVTISEAVTLMAYSELEGIRSAVVSKVFTIAIDHRFKFTVKLDQDNATVYVPVAAGTSYTMEVDWGDGSTQDTYNNQLIGAKNCKHIYSGLAGDTFQITLRGTAIPRLYFYQTTAFTQAQLYSIDDNTLEIQTDFSFNGIISLEGCTQLVSLADNSFSNALSKIGIIFKRCSSLPTLSVGLLSIFAEGGISNVGSMFSGCTALELSSAFMASLKTKLSSAINVVYGMFYNCKGNITIPDNFFDNLADDTVADFRAMTINATGVYGDAKALYDVLVTKATSSAQTTNCFIGTNLSNRNQVPTTWGGTMTV